MAEVTFEELLESGTLSTADDQVQVTVSEANPLPPGVYTLELVVADNNGLTSAPATVTIVVQDTQLPTAVIRILSAEGQLIERDAEGNVVVEFGTSIILDGGSSSDPGGGQVTQYMWQLVPQQ